jgi:hypothetical protein
MCCLWGIEAKLYSAVAPHVFHSTSSFSSPRIWFSISLILRCWRSIISCDCRYVLLPLDKRWSAEICLIRNSKGEDSMLYGVRKQPYDSAAHIIGSHTRGLESGSACMLCVRSGSILAFWLKKLPCDAFGVCKRLLVKLLPSRRAMFENADVSRSMQASQIDQRVKSMRH